MQPLTYPWHRRTARLMAVYAFGAHYHSGQSSRGYRLSCRAKRLLDRDRKGRSFDYLAEMERLLDRDERLSDHNAAAPVQIYRRLVAGYAAAV